MAHRQRVACTDEKQADPLRRLQDHGIVPREVAGRSHEVRKAVNDDTHKWAGDHRTALMALRLTWQEERAFWETMASQAEAAEHDLSLRLQELQTQSATHWTVDSGELRFGNRTQPQGGSNLAIGGWPTETGAVDDVLFIGLRSVVVVQAKRRNVHVSAALQPGVSRPRICGG